MKMGLSPYRDKERKWLKRYLCLFTCLTSSMVYLEMTNELNKVLLLNVFGIRNRSDTPVEMVSDNWENFVGADRLLKELLEALDTKKSNRSEAEKCRKRHKMTFQSST